MNIELELLVSEGPLAGRRFSVPADGLRLGRSSSCEISISDLALSRNHCLFEVRDGGLWVTDLASANGTFVNDEQLGPDSRKLQSGDRILVGDTVIRVVAPGKAAPAPDPALAADATSAPVLPKIDLGLGGDEQSPTGEAAAAARPSRLRLVLWGIALVSVLAALALVFLPVSLAPVEQEKPIPDDEGTLLSFSFEKVEASTGSIFRCLYTYKAPQLSAEIDELSEVERHMPRKTVELGDDARKRLSEILSTAKLRGFDPEYTGTPSEPGALQSFRLHVVRSARAFDVVIENGVAPQAFQDVCSQLDAFAKSELRIWAIQSTVKELLEKSAAARRVADERWAERGETNYEKFDEALKKYQESLYYLETVNPKPANYRETCELCEMVKQEIERVYKQLHSSYAKYYHMEKWELARKELQDILTLVPDSNDERYREAQSQLLELESRIKSRR